MPEEIQEIDRVRQARLKFLFDTLAAAGITQVTVTFDGCGDSGQIEDTTVEPEGKALPEHEIMWVEGKSDYTNTDGPFNTWARKWTFDTKAGKVQELLESIVWDYMDKEHPGWENNAGAYGEFIFEVNHRIVNYNHNTRFIDSRLDEYTYTEDGKQED